MNPGHGHITGGRVREASRRAGGMGRAARFTLFVAGVFAMALGIALSIRSDLGTTPITSLPLAMSVYWDALSVGMATFAMNALFVVLQFLILRRRFRPSRWLQMPAVLFFGAAIDICMAATGFVHPSAWAARLAVNFAAIPVLAFGVWLCIKSDLLLMPGDGLASAIAESLKLPFPCAKVATDTFIVASAAAFALPLVGHVVGIREGTLMAMVLVGVFVQLIDRAWTLFTTQDVGGHALAKPVTRA